MNLTQNWKPMILRLKFNLICMHIYTYSFIQISDNSKKFNASIFRVMKLFDCAGCCHC